MKTFTKLVLLALTIGFFAPSFAQAGQCELFTKDGQHFYLSKTVQIPATDAQGRSFKISSLEVLVVPTLKDTQIIFAEENGGYGMTGRITVLSEGKVVAEANSDGDIDALPHPYLSTQVQGAELKCSN